MIEGEDMDKPKQLFDQRERVLQHYTDLDLKHTDISGMWQYALEDQGIASPVVLKIALLTIVRLID